MPSPKLVHSSDVSSMFFVPFRIALIYIFFHILFTFFFTFCKNVFLCIFVHFICFAQTVVSGGLAVISLAPFRHTIQSIKGTLGIHTALVPKHVWETERAFSIAASRVAQTGHEQTRIEPRP